MKAGLVAIEIAVGLVTASIGVGCWRLGSVFAKVATGVLVALGALAIAHAAFSLFADP